MTASRRKEKKLTSVSASSSEPPELCLTEQQTARLLGYSPALVRKWRRTGGGPIFVRLGSRLVRYRLVDIQEFLRGRSVQGNGTEVRP